MLAGDPRGVAWFAQREAERPDLTGDAALLYAAFCDLQGDRQIGMGGAGPIPYTAIRAWAADNEITGDDLDWLKAGVLALQAVQMKHEADERAKLDKTKPKR